MDAQDLKSFADAQFERAHYRKTIRETAYAARQVAHNGGLFFAGIELIAFLQTSNEETVIIEDSYQNPVWVNRAVLLEDLKQAYTKAMAEWHSNFENSNRIRRGANV